MKTTTIPPLRVSPSLRRQAESVLHAGESLSGFMLDALQRSIAARRDQQAFVARGKASAAKARASGGYVSSAQVLHKLSRRLAAAQKKAVD